MRRDILLIGFYNEKALGVRYLSNALRSQGYVPHILFYKGFHSSMPQQTTERELALVKDLIARIDPLFVGLSVMSSLYLETIHQVNDLIRQQFPALPVVWGGVFATLEPRRAAEKCHYIVRGEGEEAIVRLADALSADQPATAIPNLAYRDEQGSYRENEVGPLSDLDRLGYPPIGGDHLYLIHDDKLTEGDPQLNAFTYELAASRGCPFACSYCSSVKIRQVYKGKGRYLRFRSVDSVIEEIKEAKRQIPRLRVVHFWDEIFSNNHDPAWVATFSRRYRQEINLPFRIWGHPLCVKEEDIRHLVAAGLHQIVVGLQSGSPRVRKEDFHRGESQEQIIEASRVLAACRVPKVYYDLMLCHPFESAEELKETFYLCQELAPPFWLNIHGLNFLPATDIVQKALDQGIYTEDELNRMMYSSIQDQYDQYWGPNARSFQKSSEDNIWLALIYLTQFHKLKPRLTAYAERVAAGEDLRGDVFKLQDKMKRRQRRQDLWDKAKLVLKLGS